MRTLVTERQSYGLLSIGGKTILCATLGLVFALATPANAGGRTLATNVVPINTGFAVNAISCMIANLSHRERAVTTRIISFNGETLAEMDFRVPGGVTQPLPFGPLATGARCEFDVSGNTGLWRGRGCMFFSTDGMLLEASTCSEALGFGDDDDD